MKLISTYLLLLVLSQSFFAFAVNKCTDAAGRVSYQDAACNKAQHAESVQIKTNRLSDNADNFRPVYVTIPGVGQAVLFCYRWWQFDIIEAGQNLAPTIKMFSKPGEQALRFSMTFVPNRSGRKISLQDSADTVYNIAARYVKGSVEKEVALKKLDTASGPAMFASFTEEKYVNKLVPEGEFSSITVGQISHEKVVVGFTVLSNGLNSKAREEALNILGSFQIVTDQ